VVAQGVHETGPRQILAIDVGEAETEAFSTECLRSAVLSPPPPDAVRSHDHSVPLSSSGSIPASKTTRPGRRVEETPTKRAELDPRIVKALSHPLRHRLLSRLNEGVASPKELAHETGEPLGTVSYHVRVLLELDCIELVETEQRRGAVEHFYRALMRPFSVTRIGIGSPCRHAARSSISTIADVREAAEVDGFSHPEAHISWTPLDLDAQGLQDMSELLGATLSVHLGYMLSRPAARSNEAAQSLPRSKKLRSGAPRPRSGCRGSCCPGALRSRDVRRTAWQDRRPRSRR
jgi:DNA-binding transcriptional ArsR family regulator